jgi:hypothetical protein
VSDESAGNEGMEAVASAALAASMVVVDHEVDDALSDEDVLRMCRRVGNHIVVLGNYS